MRWFSWRESGGGGGGDSGDDGDGGGGGVAAMAFLGGFDYSRLQSIAVDLSRFEPGQKSRW
jgi:hypothetical protein